MKGEDIARLYTCYRSSIVFKAFIPSDLALNRSSGWLDTEGALVFVTRKSRVGSTFGQAKRKKELVLKSLPLPRIDRPEVQEKVKHQPPCKLRKRYAARSADVCEVHAPKLE